MLLEKWDRLEGLHGRYLAGINERNCLEHIQERYSTLKREVDDIINECEGLFRRPDPRHGELGMDCELPVWDPKQDDDKSVHSVATHVTKHSEVLSVYSQKKSLKRALVSKMKVNLARASQGQRKMQKQQEWLINISKGWNLGALKRKQHWLSLNGKLKWIT